jgi:hypothetical protein
MTVRLVAAVLCLGGVIAAQAPASRDVRRTALATTSPSNEIVRLDLDGDRRPDIVERWWNGKRVRWLDENGDLAPTDTRGDQVADVMQVDMNGDGWYDGVTDQSIKWADNDGDGRPDVQAWSTQPPSWTAGRWSTNESHWMLFLDLEKDGVLGWQDWQTFNFGNSNWDYTGTHDWLPDYHGDALFLKIHRPPQALPDPRLNWENPFAFYDTDGNGFLDTVAFDYDGDRTFDFRVSLLDFRTPGGPAPDAAPIIDTRAAGWKGLHEAYTKIANQSWLEALAVYRAAWKRGLTTPEMDRLANAGSVAERHANAYWIKEKAFREIRSRLKEAREMEPPQAATLDALEKDLARLYYLGRFDEYVARIASVPGI